MKPYEIIRFEELKSTNDHIKEHLQSLPDHTLVLTDHQTKGRGRRSNTWESEAGMNFLGSFYKIVPSGPSHHFMMQGVLAIIKTLRSLGIEASIKPPNDVYVQGKKIAGVLSEVIHKHKQHVIIGMGLNVNESKKAPAVALIDLARRTYSLEYITSLIKTHMEATERLDDHTIFEAYKSSIPFNRIQAGHSSASGSLQNMDEDFTCTVNGNKMPCESLTFTYKR